MGGLFRGARFCFRRFTVLICLKDTLFSFCKLVNLFILGGGGWGIETENSPITDTEHGHRSQITEKRHLAH